MDESTSQEHRSRREREKLARQHDILEAARLLFAAKGFRDTTLDEIAQKAEFSKGTLYNYFSSKEEIFYAIIDDAIERSLEMARVCAVAPGDLRSRLTAYARNNMLFIRGNGELLHAIFQELHRGRKSDTSKLHEIFNRSRAVSEVLAPLLVEEIKAGRIREGDPIAYITMLDDLVRGFASRHVTLHNDLTDERIQEASSLLVSVVLDGIVIRNNKG